MGELPALCTKATGRFGSTEGRQAGTAIIRALAKARPALGIVAHREHVRPRAQVLAEVDRHLLRHVDVRDAMALRLTGPGEEVAVSRLPRAPPHRVVGMPVGIEAPGHVADLSSGVFAVIKNKTPTKNQ